MTVYTWQAQGEAGSCAAFWQIRPSAVGHNSSSHLASNARSGVPPPLTRSDRWFMSQSIPSPRFPGPKPVARFDLPNSHAPARLAPSGPGVQLPVQPQGSPRLRRVPGDGVCAPRTWPVLGASGWLGSSGKGMGARGRAGLKRGSTSRTRRRQPEATSPRRVRVCFRTRQPSTGRAISLPPVEPSRQRVT